jgi:hypothetical protein
MRLDHHACDDRDHRDTRPDGQIDAARNHQHRHPHGQDAKGGYLLKDIAEVARRKKHRRHDAQNDDQRDQNEDNS